MVPFVTFELAPGQVLPEPLQELDLVMAQPMRQGGRALVPFQFVARNISGDDMHAVAADLEELCYGFNSRYHDPVTGRWEAEGAFDLSQVDDPVLQMVPGLMDRIDLPWIHVRKGERYLRMAPLSDLDAFPLQARVEKELRRHGDRRRVILSYQDFNEYLAWKARLAPPGQAEPRSYF